MFVSVYTNLLNRLGLVELHWGRDYALRFINHIGHRVTGFQGFSGMLFCRLNSPLFLKLDHVFQSIDYHYIGCLCAATQQMVVPIGGSGGTIAFNDTSYYLKYGPITSLSFWIGTQVFAYVDHI